MQTNDTEGLSQVKVSCQDASMIDRSSQSNIFSSSAMTLLTSTNPNSAPPSIQKKQYSGSNIEGEEGSHHLKFSSNHQHNNQHPPTLMHLQPDFILKTPRPKNAFELKDADRVPLSEEQTVRPLASFNLHSPDYTNNNQTTHLTKNDNIPNTNYLPQNLATNFGGAHSVGSYHHHSNHQSPIFDPYQPQKTLS